MAQQPWPWLNPRLTTDRITRMEPMPIERPQCHRGTPNELLTRQIASLNTRGNRGRGVQQGTYSTLHKQRTALANYHRRSGIQTSTRWPQFLIED